MFKRKLIFTVCCIVACSFAYAAGASKSVIQSKSKDKAEKVDVAPIAVGDTAPMPQIQNSVPHLGVFVDGFMGYNFANWSKFTDGGNGAWANIGGGIRPSSNQRGSFTFGLDLGYQIIRYFGLEFGYYDMQKVNGNQLSVTTPYFYFATRFSIPFLSNDDMSIFAKLGAAYRMIEYGGGARQGVYNNKRYNINYLYGVGAQYYFTHRWRASLQWLGMPATKDGNANTKSSSKQVPMTNQILVGLGYLFSL